MQRGFGGFWSVVIDGDHMLRFAVIAGQSTGIIAPHPNSACVIERGAKIIAQGFLRTIGGQSAELQALRRRTAHGNHDIFEFGARYKRCPKDALRNGDLKSSKLGQSLHSSLFEWNFSRHC
ncbi:hypothetical protein SUGI_0386830 [Cryptomeria japonica]|nr:hypothetical protein SUGI_0386830 [Cryptomeria japonica]